MATCYTGSILIADLDKGELSIDHPAEDFYRKYGGGSAMGMYYILRDMPPAVDALAPGNVLTLFAGLATGLPISGQSRLSANARSPQGGAIGDSQSGGYFPAWLKFSGFDGVVVKGKASHPVYLHLQDGRAELRDAAHLWGKTTAEVDEILKKELDDEKIEVLQAGPAGENLVRYAALISMSNRANGRTGMGAVMGSKNLRAVVAHGSHKVAAQDVKTLVGLSRQGTKEIPNNPDIKALQQYGSAGVVATQNATGTFPTRNFNEGQFEGFETLTGEYMSDTILKNPDTCYACTVRCKRVVEAEFQRTRVLPVYGGPEYETLATLGSYCGVADLNAVALANQYCGAYGLDTISCGAAISFAMECFENGLITSADTGGLELRYGNAEAMLAMIEKIARREGFGDVLAEGTDRAAEIIGKNARDYLITVKGTEAPAHMPQAKKSLGLIYAVNPFGADHQSTEHDPMYETGASDLYLTRLARIGLTQPQPAGSMNDEKARLVYQTQLFYSALDTYNVCQYVWGPAYTLFGPDEMVTMLKAATGWEITLDEIMAVGERRLNMMRAFNAREGFDRRSDTLPKKFFKPLQGTGPTAGVAWIESDLEHYKDVYYDLAGWDRATGNPNAEKLAGLGLEWIEL